MGLVGVNRFCSREPGTTVVSRYLSLFTSVIGLKVIAGKHYAVVDSDYHHVGETGHMMRCPYTVIKGNDAGEVLAAPGRCCWLYLFGTGHSHEGNA